MTADDLLANINTRGALPPTAGVWTPALILAAADEEVWSAIMPALLSINQDFFVDSEDKLLIANQKAYALPKRAAGGGVRVVKYLDADNNEGPGLPLIEIPDIGRYDVSDSSSATVAIYFTATHLNALPTPATGITGSLRVYYDRRPGSLVQDTVVSSQHTKVATVASASVAGGNTTITCNANHSGFAASGTIDITSPTPPYTVKWKDITVTTMSAGTPTIVCNGNDLTVGVNALAAGDYVTSSTFSYVPQGIPVEWHSLIELRTVARILDSIGDVMGAESILAKAAAMEGRLMSLSAPRSSGNHKKLSAWR